METFILVLVMLLNGEAGVAQKPFATKVECVEYSKIVSQRIVDAGDQANVLYLACHAVKAEDESI